MLEQLDNERYKRHIVVPRSPMLLGCEFGNRMRRTLQGFLTAIWLSQLATHAETHAGGRGQQGRCSTTDDHQMQVLPKLPS